MILLALDMNHNRISYNIIIGACLSSLYVMAFTSGVNGAETDTSHNIELQYNNGSVQTMTLYDRPGDDFQQNKGDLWEFRLSCCITLSAITRVSVVENGNDGWNIGSIVTLVRDPSNRIQVLTWNFGVNRWIDGDGSYSSHRRYELTLSTSDISSGIINSMAKSEIWVIIPLVTGSEACNCTR